MTHGMNIVVPAPRPLPRPWATALTTYFELDTPEYGVDAKGVMRWMNGVKFVPFGCDKIVGDTVDPCVERTTDYMDGMDAEVSFDPFMSEVAVQCSVVTMDRADLEAYLVAHTEVGRSSILAAQVEHSAYTTTNPSLASEAQVISNADQSLIGALIAVEDALADVLDGGMGMIHMPAGLLSALNAGGGVVRGVDGKPYTITGHLIVADAGYLGVSPNTNAVANGEVWIYGSGPVFAKYSPNITWGTLNNEVIDFTRDQWNLAVQQVGIAIFEPCSVVAAKVDTSDSDVINET